MQYSDDGITLDYDKLKDSFPAGRGWSRFLKSKTKKIGSDDFIYYGKHKGSQKAFNPPIITDSINITNKKLLRKASGFDEEDIEEEKEEQLLEQSKKDDHQNTEIVDDISKSSIFGNLKKDQENIDSVNIEEDNNKEISNESFIVDLNRSEQDFDKEIKMTKDETVIEKVRKIQKFKRESRLRRKKAREGESNHKQRIERRLIKETGRERKEDQEESSLLNRIPTFLGEYEPEKIYNINKLFYFDPINPSL